MISIRPVKTTLIGIVVLMTPIRILGQDVGIFEGHGDIGGVKHEGSVDFNPSKNTYTIKGSGGNMWFDKDEFHFLWKKVSGDVALTADIKLLGEGSNPHRKAGLMIRQNLKPNSAYADIVVHGDGLTSLQFREILGENTREVKSNIKSPKTIGIEKSGDYISISGALCGNNLESLGGTVRLPFKSPFYIGLAVCSHDKDELVSAEFSNVQMTKPVTKPDSLRTLYSTLETIDVESRIRQVVYHSNTHIEAPNWTPDGSTLIYNSDGLLYTIPVEGGNPEIIPTGFANKINNDHGISLDGTQMVISDQTETGKSLIYTLPREGGEPKKITSLGPSYWHGWSPDGKTLAYCAEREENYDIYTIPFMGGAETRLTTAEGLDDGPDYSPDGNYIYFNSERTGTMQIWRMKADGSQKEQITNDEHNDWFPHPSPDGKWIAYVTFGKQVPSNSHPPNKDIMLRLMNLETKEIKVLAKIFGGQGTMNVPSWSPDSRRLAFVSYQLK